MAQIRIIDAKVKETMVGTMVIEMIGMGPMFLLKIVKLFLRIVEVVWHELSICCTK